jgi:uncharacterized protein YjbJ (UPF0337 family)
MAAAKLAGLDLRQPARCNAFDLNQGGRAPCVPGCPQPRKAKAGIMSRQRIEGAAQKAVGAAKQAVGKAVGNEKLQREGMADRVVGSAKEAIGKLQDVVHKSTR